MAERKHNSSGYRLFKTTYRDRRRQKREAAKWYVEFRDHAETIRRLPGFTDRVATDETARKIVRLAALRAADEAPDRQLSQWLERTPKRIRECLCQWGLIDPHKLTGTKALSGHIDDYRDTLNAAGRTDKHADLTANRVRRVVAGCGFTFHTDISASKVQRYLGDLRDGGDGISQSSFNHYMRAFKMFCQWMVRDRRALEHPVDHLRQLTVTQPKRVRRALTVDEARTLLDSTQNGPEHHGMTGQQRALLYRMAIETGLRASELASLTHASFDLSSDSPTVSVAARVSKRRRQDAIPLRADTASVMRAVLASKAPAAPVFHLGRNARTAEMLRADLKAASIPYRDDAGRVADFHSLRHTTGSFLAVTGASPKVAQSIMRHSDINLTMGVYTHSYREDEAAAVDKLPDLSHDSQRQRATGTADSHADDRDDSRLALCLAQKGGSDETGRDVNRRSSNQNTGGGTRTHTGFNSQRILNPPRLPIPPHRRVLLLRDHR